MTLLAQLMTAPDEQADVVRAVRVVTGEAILLHRWMFKQQRAALFRMAFVASVIGRTSDEHLATLSAVRVMARGTTHFHHPIFRAEQMSRALEQRLPNLLMTAQTRVLHRKVNQHIFRRLEMVDAMA